jgi:hypothetical protein
MAEIVFEAIPTELKANMVARKEWLERNGWKCEVEPRSADRGASS